MREEETKRTARKQLPYPSKKFAPAHCQLFFRWGKILVGTKFLGEENLAKVHQRKINGSLDAGKPDAAKSQIFTLSCFANGAKLSGKQNCWMDTVSLLQSRSLWCGRGRCLEG